MRAPVKKAISVVLRVESRLVLARYKPKIVAITGSVGKTSTKDAIYAVMAKNFYVRKSEKSYNSELGLPLTILGLPNAWNNPWAWAKVFLKGAWLFIWPHKYPKWLVLEVGVGKPGDMKKTASWLKTDAVVITAIGDTPAHIEFFNSPAHLVEEKSGLIKTLKKDGLLILNSDDEAVMEMKSKTKCRLVTYGLQGEPDVLGSGDTILYSDKNEPEGLIFRADADGKSLPVSIEGVFGRNHIYASLAALALSFGFKWNMIDAIDALKNFDVPPGRMRLLKGIKDTFIIDDTYNSSPFSCESALRTLGELKGGRKIAVLGDMLELGKHTIEAHKNVGKVASQNVGVLLVVGPRASSIKDGAIEAGMNAEDIFEFPNAYEAGSFIKDFIKKGDFILVKGSQGMRMERVVSEIILDQENKSKLLVRHDTEWLNKK
jgi:UDP-N-acetylmuramoyl-tripeptide--D-alanyl-D-alanine ligase